MSHGTCSYTCLYVRAVTVLCYSCSYDMIFLTYILKPNINYIATELAPCPNPPPHPPRMKNSGAHLNTRPSISARLTLYLLVCHTDI